MPAFIYVSYQCCIAGWFQVILLPVGLFFVCLTANFLIIRNNRKAKKIRTKSKNNFLGLLGEKFQIYCNTNNNNILWWYTYNADTN